MISPKNVEITASIRNADSQSIVSNSTIDISLTQFDISASSYTASITLNFDKNEIVLDNEVGSSRGDIYFTPLYTEKISYETWKNTINKSFTELT